MIFDLFLNLPCKSVELQGEEIVFVLLIAEAHDHPLIFSCMEGNIDLRNSPCYFLLAEAHDHPLVFSCIKEILIYKIVLFSYD
jgi:hypothetical protein